MKCNFLGKYNRFFFNSHKISHKCFRWMLCYCIFFYIVYNFTMYRYLIFLLSTKSLKMSINDCVWNSSDDCITFVAYLHKIYNFLAHKLFNYNTTFHTKNVFVYTKISYAIYAINARDHMKIWSGEIKYFGVMYVFAPNMKIFQKF